MSYGCNAGHQHSTKTDAVICDEAKKGMVEVVANNLVAVADGLIVQATELERQAKILRSQATLLYREARQS